MQFANLLVAFDQPREPLLQHCFGLVFVELWDLHRLGKRDAGIAIDGGHNLCSLLVPDRWPRADAIEQYFLSRPVLPQSAGLRFPDRGKLVVILLEKGRLCMPNQKKAAHASPNSFSTCVHGINFHAAVTPWLWWNSANVLPS